MLCEIGWTCATRIQLDEAALVKDFDRRRKSPILEHFQQTLGWQKEPSSCFKHTSVTFVTFTWPCEIASRCDWPWLLVEGRNSLNSLKADSADKTLGVGIVNGKWTSGATTMKRKLGYSWANPSRKHRTWLAHAYSSCANFTIIWTSYWNHFAFAVENWCKIRDLMLIRSRSCAEALAANKELLWLNVLVKMRNFVLVLQDWQMQTTLVCQLLLNVKQSKKHEIQRVSQTSALPTTTIVVHSSN